MAFWKPDDRGSVFLGSLERTAVTGESGENVLHVPRQGPSGTKLPIFACRDEILFALEENETVVLVGETGSGKSTQLVQYLRAANWTDAGRFIIASTQPRRVAATMLAARVAQEQGVELGGLVGYKIRFESRCCLSRTPVGQRGSGPTPTEILFLTDGMMVQELLRDPLLSAYSVIIVDEAHERSAHSDLLLALLKRVQLRRRPPLLKQHQDSKSRMSSLRLVVASASLDAAAMLAYFPATSVAVRVPGRQYPVDLHYLSEPCRDYIQQVVDTVLSLHREFPCRPSRGHNGTHTQHQQQEDGDILVFLPGKEEIALVQERLAFAADNDADPSGQGRAGLSENLVVLPLHSALSRHQQLLAFEPAPRGQRKIILATNIAETSVTLPSIRYVVDSCLHRVPYHDHGSNCSGGGGVQYLVTEAISQAAATQRAGRAGRCGPGKVYRLCAEDWFHRLPSASVPEIQRSDLAWPVLQLMALGVTNIAVFDFVSPPPAAAIAKALEVLYSLQAVDGAARITPTGLACARMATNPRLARALLWALQEGCAEEMLSVAAMVSVESPYVPQRERERERVGDDRAKRRRGDDSASGDKDRDRDRDRDGNNKGGLTDFVDLSGDHVTLMRLLTGFLDTPEPSRRSWCTERDASYSVLSRAASVRASLRKALQSAAHSWGGVGEGAGVPGELVLASCGDDAPLVLRCLVGGYFSNVARLGADGNYHPLSQLRAAEGLNGAASATPPLRLHPSSVLSRFPTAGGSDYVLFQEAEGATGRLGHGPTALLSGRGAGFVVRMRETSKVRAAWLLQMAPHFYSKAK